MPKILVSLADPAEQEEIASALRLKKYNIVAVEPPGPDETPKNLAQRLLDQQAAAAVLDYRADDAASVKMLQAATDLPGAPRFIFLLPGDVPVSHILTAVNEGASALLERPVAAEALANYVGRAISGPARFRCDLGGDGSQNEAFAEMEKEVQTMRAQSAANRRLVSLLMSTPIASQHRTALVVSDSNYQRDYLKKLLEDHGFHVSMAKNPEEGVATALEEKPRVVVSDLEMEGKNGVEFCRELKIENKFMPCYFVICTANSEKAEQVIAPGNGVDACVIKPSNESGNQELIANVAMGLLL